MTRPPRAPDGSKGNADARFEAWTTEGEPVVDMPKTAAPRRRARELGLWFGHGRPGPSNSITDVAGVRVGYSTIVHGDGKLTVGEGPARTGVTAILPVTTTSPEDSIFLRRLPAGGYVLNGAGEMIGLTQIQEWGILETPIVLTNTHSVGVAHRALVEHMVKEVPEIGQAHDTVIPVVAECDDSWLNDICGHHVTTAHVHAALARASSADGVGVIDEGTVGSGTGMTTFDFAGGIGTSSRVLRPEEGGYTVGVLVQSNFGRMQDLRLGGIPIGAVIEPGYRAIHKRGGDYGSIIVVVATDAPLLPLQLQRVARRAALGIGRTGSGAAHASGEIVLAFSTANRLPRISATRVKTMDVLSDEHIDPVFRATIDAVEEAIANAICMANDMVGVNSHAVPALPLDRVADLVRRCTPAELHVDDG
jgi:D-aminopeptidase